LILQGFNPLRAVVKKPFLGYNMSYFLHAVFRTGKRSRDSRKLSPLKRIRARRVRAAKAFGQVKSAPVRARQIVPERFIGWKL
jgi:hypothetical protein